MNDSWLESFYYTMLCETDRDYCHKSGRYIYKPMPLIVQTFVMFCLFLSFCCAAILIFLLCALISKMTGVALITFPMVSIFIISVCHYLNKKFTNIKKGCKNETNRP